MKRGWRKVEDEEPPMNPVASGVGWRDALLWGMMAGAAAGAGRVIARRGTAYLQNRAGG